MKSLIPFALLLFTGCVVVIGGSRLRGSGHRAERSLELDPFDTVILDTAAQVTVRVGPPASVTYSCDDDLLDYVRFRVRDGVLRVDVTESVTFRSELRITLTTPRLERLEIDGAAEVRIEGVTGSRLSVAVDGAGDVDIGGRVDRVEVFIDGAGDVRLDGLQAREAHVEIDGSGAVSVNASETVAYTIDGAGDIRYRGDPDVSGRIDGVGTVYRKP